MARPELWIIAGPNGAGKTTLVAGTKGGFGLPADAYINPDAVTLAYLQEQGIKDWKEAPPGLLKQTFVRAANDSQRLLEERMELGKAAVIESVLSTSKYCEVVERVLELGGTFNLVYVGLNSPLLSRQRVGLRVMKGGHDVPEDKFESRWQKSLELLPWFAFRATRFWVFDNSNPERFAGGQLLVSGNDHVLHLHGIPTDDFRVLISQFLNKFEEMNTGAEWKIELEDFYRLPST